MMPVIISILSVSTFWFPGVEETVVDSRAVQPDSLQQPVMPVDTVPEGEERLLELDEAIAIALERNYGIRIQRQRTEVAINNRTLGNAGFLPSLELTGSRSEQIENSRFQLSGDPDVQENLGAVSSHTSAGVALNWTFFDGMRMFLGYERLGELEELGRVELRLRMEETIQQMIEAYGHAARVASQLSVLEETMEVTRERIEIVETMRDLGIGSEYDLLEARTDLNADSAAVLREDNRLVEAKVTLNELMGRDREYSFTVTAEIPLNEELRFDEIRSSALQENTRLRQARISRRVADLEYREVTRERYPELEVTSGYRYNRTDGGGGFMRFNETDGFSVGLTARINLFDGFDTSRRIQNARILEKSSRLEFEEANHQLESNLLRVWQRYLQSLDLVALERRNLGNVEERMEIALERFREGMISALEFREAQRAFLAAESRLIEARYEAKVAETELLRLGGDLSDVVY